MSSPSIPLSSSLTSSGIVLSVKVWIPVEKHEDFFHLMRPVYDAVVAEPECRFFVITKNPQEPEAISWFEGWSKDTDWLMNVQLQKEYYQPYLATTESWFVKPRWFEILSPVDGLVSFKVPEK
ncbi:hypothetical protein PV10_08798 [Exophiala mesophila]|uniref:ABM domain-containing protein n=1 Tax=Exophiala mesophila TaxID=212818 RepID=A0A0D1XM12_EXOME|nr:uncharacterized protein PV10_08798 [Exophiala mesophila]KIV89211.1 hypothetical protein PV10_08798 [Exophiala mesophila]